MYYIYIHMLLLCAYMYIYIYIYRERERLIMYIYIRLSHRLSERHGLVKIAESWRKVFGSPLGPDEVACTQYTTYNIHFIIVYDIISYCNVLYCNVLYYRPVSAHGSLPSLTRRGTGRKANEHFQHNNANNNVDNVNNVNNANDDNNYSIMIITALDQTTIEGTL